MINSWTAFDTAVKLSEQALAFNQFKSYADLKQLLHKLFFQFDKDFRNYKAYIIEKTVKTEEIFNGLSLIDQSGQRVPTYVYNDSWALCQMTRYSDAMEYLEDEMEADQNYVEAQSNQDFYELLLTFANSEFNVIEKAINKLQNRIVELPDKSVMSVS